MVNYVVKRIKRVNRVKRIKRAKKKKAPRKKRGGGAFKYPTSRAIGKDWLRKSRTYKGRKKLPFPLPKNNFAYMNFLDGSRLRGGALDKSADMLLGPMKALNAYNRNRWR